MKKSLVVGIVVLFLASGLGILSNEIKGVIR